MARRTLWEVIDIDRRRWVRPAVYVTLAVAALVFAVWAVFHRVEVPGRLVGKAAGVIVALMVFPAAKKAAERGALRTLKPVPADPARYAETFSALNDVTIASGTEPGVKLLTAESSAVNAFVTDAEGGLEIVVTSAFSRIPPDEQEAGFALLFGRRRVEIEAFAADCETSDSDGAAAQAKLLSAWTAAAIAGDREGLLILKDPRPAVALMERLSETNSVMPQASGVRRQGMYGFLAWPRALPSRKTPSPEKQRLDKLLEVTGAEGWGAAQQAQKRLSAAALAAATSPEPPASPVVATPAMPPAVAAGAAAPRAYRTCPACGADNAPGNSACIVCGSPLPH